MENTLTMFSLGLHLTSACEAYGVEGVTVCLEGLLVFEASKRTTCALTLKDELFLFLAQPSPDSGESLHTDDK